MPVKPARNTPIVPATSPDPAAAGRKPRGTGGDTPAKVDGFSGGGKPPKKGGVDAHVPLPTIAIGASKPAAKNPALMPAQNFFLNPPGWTPPIDFNLVVPDTVRALYPIFSPTRPTNGGEFNSRHETESKLALPLEKVDMARRKLEELVKDPAKVTQIFGEGWTMHRGDRYFESDPIKDASGNAVLDAAGKPKTQVKLDAQGLPIAKVMSDVIYDDENYSLTKSRSVLRFREFEGDKFNMVNFKPGFGKWDGKIISRIEYALLVAPGIKEDPSKMADFFESDEHLNFFRYAYDAAPGIDARQLKPRLENSDTRYRYVLKNDKNLDEIEISLDHVKGRARGLNGPDGKLKEIEFAQFEMESMHTNIIGASWDLTKPEHVKQSREGLEEARRKGLIPAADKVQPQIHIPTDALNTEVQATPSYKGFSKAIDQMTHFVYGNEIPVVNGEQKARKIAELLGIVR